MKISLYISNFLKSLYESIRRFPISIGLSTVFVVLMIIISETRSYSSQSVIEKLERVSMILALGFALSLGIKVFFEKKELTKLYQKLIAIAFSLIFLILYYFYLLKDFNIIETTRYVGITLVFYISFIFIPYLEGKKNFELYVIKFFGRLFITIIYSGVLYAGLSAILATIDKLLEVNVPSDFYFYTFLVVAGIFAPTYYLGGLPNIEDIFDKENYSNIFRVLLLYIIMPLIGVYTIILYIYFTKIIVTVKWPVGLVSHLVLWYALISSGVLFFITPIFKDRKYTSYFMKILPKSIIPLMVLMFISIGIRIKAYGITENRYYVIALSLWVFCAMIYFSFTKNYKNIVLPITLSIIILITILGGPISSYEVSFRSQSNRLKNILVSNNMFKDSVIIKNENISEKDKNEISSILEYINRNHNLSDISYLSKDFKIENMDKVFGFSLYLENYYEKNNFYFTSMQNGTPIDISGYDYMFDSRNMNQNEGKNQDSVSYDYSSNLFKVFKGNDVIYIKNIKEIGEKIVDKYGMGGKGIGIEINDMIFKEENSNIKIKFIIINLSGTKNSSNDGITLNGIEYYVLYKIK